MKNTSSFFADAIRANPGVYKKLKDKKTKLGCTLGHCIKTGVDNPGMPFQSFSSLFSRKLK